MIRVWKIAPGPNAYFWPECFQRHCISINWLNSKNLLSYDEKVQITAALLKRQDGKARSSNSIWLFSREVEEGHVIIANNGQSCVVGIGIAKTGYLPPDHPKNPNRQESIHWQVVLVDWMINAHLDLGEKVFVRDTVDELEREKWQMIRRAYQKEYPEYRETLNMIFFRKADSKPTLSNGSAVSSMGKKKNQGNGAGFGSYLENKLVETAAIEFVRREYESRGWNVTSRELDRVGYDLDCRKGKVVHHVEVKGVRGPSVSFIITSNETLQAENDPKFVLNVVTSALSKSKSITSYSGREFLKLFDRKAIQYMATLKK